MFTLIYTHLFDPLCLRRVRPSVAFTASLFIFMKSFLSKLCHLLCSSLRRQTSSLLSPGTVALFQGGLTLLILLCHKTPLVGISNAQEMALFGSVQSLPGKSEAASQTNGSPSSALSKVFVWYFCC